jgi:hypothetical protein
MTPRRLIGLIVLAAVAAFLLSLIASLLSRVLRP